jgi:hypothetical protein
LEALPDSALFRFQKRMSKSELLLLSRLPMSSKPESPSLATMVVEGKARPGQAVGRR